jgi:hypothetical protein
MERFFFGLLRGVAGFAGAAFRALDEICINDISAVLSATDLRFRLFFII